MASTSRSSSVGSADGATSRAPEAEAHPTPILPWRGHPMRNPMAMAMSSPVSSLSSAASLAVLSRRRDAAATSADVATSVASFMAAQMYDSGSLTVGSPRRQIDDPGVERSPQFHVPAVSRPSLSRREVIAALASTAVLPLLPACMSERESTPSSGDEANALGLLDECAEHLLAVFPESATSLGIDTGNRAALRSQLSDRSEAGKKRIADQVRADLERVNAFDATGLSYKTRTSIEVVKSAYGTELEGFALPYGDQTVRSWRTPPYVVIQNVGAYLDIPRFLDSDHRIENAGDAEAYLARLQSYARQLDGELGRIQAAREMGLIPPAFLLDKALGQLGVSLKNAHEGGSVVESIERRTKEKGIPGTWAEP